MKYVDNITIICHINAERKSTVSQSVAQRTIYSSVATKLRSWLLILEKRRQRHTAVYISGAEVEQVNRLYLPGNQHHRGLITVITYLHSQKRLYCVWKLRKAKSQSQILVRFYRGTIENILIGNITNWHGSSRPRTGRLCSGLLKPPEHQEYHLQSISHISKLRCLQRAQRILKPYTVI